MTPDKQKPRSQMTLAEINALIPEPTAEQKKAAHDAAREEEAQIQLRKRANAFFVLAQGMLVRTDISGWQHIDACVVSDDGPADKRDRRITIQKVSGRNAGEVTTISRDRVKLVSGN